MVDNDTQASLQIISFPAYSHREYSVKFLLQRVPRELRQDNYEFLPKKATLITLS